MLRVIEWLGLFVFNVMVCILGCRLLVLYGAVTESLVLALLVLPIAYFLSDLFTGFVHWVCDSIGSSTTPLWGPMLVKPFRDHHREPAKITKISLAENLGSSSLAAVIVMLFSYPILDARLGVALAWFWLWFLLFGTWSNLFHRWSHIPASARPRWMKVLQAKGIILNPRTHSIHHRRPHRRNYCILNGWANIVTNRIPWPAFESALLRAGVKINFD